MHLYKGPISAFSLVAILGTLLAYVPESAALNPFLAKAITNDGTLKFEIKSFTSRSMGKDRKYGIVLPPDYQASPKKRYPVIFLLHGGHGSEKDWVEKIGLLPVLESLYHSGSLPPSIVVTPDGNDNRSYRLGSYDPNYYDGPNGNVGTLIGSELPNFLKTQYQTWSNPQLWAIGGLSSGGWGALNIGLRHLDQFCVFFSEIGYFTDKSGPQNSPALFVKSLPISKLRQIHVYSDAGVDDLKHPIFINSSREFHRVLDQLQVDNEFHPFPGGHGSSGPDYGSNYVRKHAYDALGFIGKNFQSTLKSIK